MIAISNVDLLLVGIAIAGAAMLGVSVFVTNSRSATARSLLLYAFVTIGWSMANYASYRLEDAGHILIAIRFVLFFASWHALSFLLLAWNFPLAESPIRRAWFAALAAWTSFISVLTFTPFVYHKVLAIDPTIQTSTGPGIALFGLTVVAFITAGIGLLAWRFWKAGTERRQYEFVFAGVVITFAFVIVFNFLFPAFLNNADLIPYGGLFQLPLIVMTSYAILRHRLFNVKIAGTALIVFALSLVSVIEIIIAQDASLVIFRSSVFVLILVTGGILIRSVYKEVEQRELIEKQEKELEDINRQQESLLHFISHEVKGYLTKSEAAFAAIFAGDYGEVQPKLHDMSGLALADVRKGVDTVIDILDASNLRRGTVSFKKDTFNLVAAIEEIVRDLQIEAQARGLELVFEKPVTGAYIFIGDEEKLRRHVIRNLVDNSVKYTLKGFVRVQLARTRDLMRITISDSGVGITPEDMRHLFTEGGKGAESIKVNVHSTGYGLFIAKTIVEGHGGKIWAESEGKDKGSRFIVELPVSSA